MFNSKPHPEVGGGGWFKPQNVFPTCKNVITMHEHIFSCVSDNCLPLTKKNNLFLELSDQILIYF